MHSAIRFENAFPQLTEDQEALYLLHLKTEDFSALLLYRFRNMVDEPSSPVSVWAHTTVSEARIKFWHLIIFHFLFFSGHWTAIPHHSNLRAPARKTNLLGELFCILSISYTINISY